MNTKDTTTTTNSSTNLYHGSAPHGLRASIVSIPSELMDHALDVTSVESVHSDDVDHHDNHLMNTYDEVAVDHYDDDDILTDTESSDDDDDYDDDDEWEEERRRILDDVRQLKSMAEFYLHPEIPVKSSGIESARCYFDRYSASTNSIDDDERNAILADVAALKQSAVHYLHPEISVVTTDPFACGRNYFTRYGASETEVDEDERNQILQDAAALKQQAVNYLHPEIPMTGSIACSRNFFTRYSAPEYEVDFTERNQILKDVKALRMSASHFYHPERPVVNTDATTFGRNYFTRFSAPKEESYDEVMQRTQIIDDMNMLKQFAKHYLHPELPVETSDATVFGRNYFLRHSAPEQESMEEYKIRQQVLEDTNAFHQLAVEYLHPELPVVIYATATGRNYFTRGSGPEYDSLEDAQIRSQVMDDMKSFKALAVNFLHPELPVVVYATSTGRNYFTRPDAEVVISHEDLDERDRILADAKALKQTAVHFLHPELPVVTTDGTACGRNYFSRYSACPYETSEYSNDRDLVLEDAKALRQLAIDYKHPEIPMKTSIACARNYYSRGSADVYDDVDTIREREQIVADALALKKHAVDFMHPELPVTTTDPTLFGRNYFTRFSSPQSSDQEEQERATILAEASALKKHAVDYMHPELPVKSTVPCGRNYFDRPSSKMHDQMIHTFPSHHEEDEDLDHHYNEHIDHFGLMDEEMELYNDLRAELETFPMVESNNNGRNTGKYGTTLTRADSEVGSNLSRSPSSVFLFGLDE